MSATTLNKKKSLKNLHLKQKRDSEKNNFKQSISTLMNKWKEIFKSITHNTLDELENYSSDEQIDAMFQKHKRDRNIIKFNKILQQKEINSSNDASLSNHITSNSNLEMKLTDTNTSLSNNESSKLQQDIVDLYKDNTHLTESRIEETFDNYDDVFACQQLRLKRGEPFIDAVEIWEHRRELWQQVTNDTTKEQIDESREEFQRIPSEYYDRIYKKLVIEDKPLREPLNLQDALKVINAGWTETKKWERAANGVA